MDKRGRRWIGVHNQTFQTGGYGEDKPEKDVFQEDVPEGDVSEEEWAEKEGIEKDAPEGGEILESALSVEESSPARAADRDGMTSVKRGFTIRLDERKIHIYQVEEGYEDRERSGDSGSD